MKSGEAAGRGIGMSMALVAFAVPADLTAQVAGSRSRAVLNRVLRHADHFASVDGYIREQVADGNKDPDAPTVGAVLKDIVYGRPVDGRWGFQWAEAVEAACAALGERLPNTGFSPMRAAYAGELDAAAERAGVGGAAFGFTRLLLDRGLVLPAPDPRQVDVAAGFLTAAEVRRARRAFDRGRYAGLRHEDRHALGVIRGWLAVCETLDWGLATFYS
jgi:hypothetical protein